MKKIASVLVFAALALTLRMARSEAGAHPDGGASSETPVPIVLPATPPSAPPLPPNPSPRPRRPRGNDSRGIGDGGFPPNSFFVGDADTLRGWCSGGQVGAGDFNHDGRSDLYCHLFSDGSTWISLARSDGLAMLTPSKWFDNWCHTGANFGVADFNGDGYADLWCHDYPSGSTWTANNATDGSGFVATGVNGNPTLSSWCTTGGTFMVGLFNSDANADFLCRSPTYNGGTVWIDVANVSGTSFSPGWSLSSFCFDDGTANPPPNFGFADFDNSNGPDLFCHSWTAGTSVALSTGAAFAAATNWNSTFCTFPTNSSSRFGVGSFNRDGAADIWCWDSAAGINIASSVNTAFVYNGEWYPAWGPSSGFRGNVGDGTPFDDYNLDNISDFSSNTGPSLKVLLGVPDFNQFVDGTDWVDNFHDWCSGASTGTVISGDFNGDGRTDVACTNSTGDTSVANSNSIPLVYNYGTVFTNPQVYWIFYGTWTPDQEGLVTTFLVDLSASSWFNILHTYYYNYQGDLRHYVSSTFALMGGTAFGYLAGSDSHSLATSDVSTIVATSIANNNWQPDYANAVFLVLTSADVTPYAYGCNDQNMGACGKNEYLSPYEVVVLPNPGYAGAPPQGVPNNPLGYCMGCEQLNTVVSPNGDTGVDAMLTVVAHELVEAITDPKNDGWQDGPTQWTDPQSPTQCADLCAKVYGPLTTTLDGSYYNLSLQHGNYLVQQNFLPVTPSVGYCSMQP